EVAVTQERHSALDARSSDRHAATRPRRAGTGGSGAGPTLRSAGERFAVLRLPVILVDPVTNPAQPHQIAQLLRGRRWFGSCSARSRPPRSGRFDPRPAREAVAD